MFAHRQRGHDEAGKHEVHAHHLHRRGHGNGKEQIKNQRRRLTPHGKPRGEHTGGDQRQGQEARPCGPENLPDQQIFEVLAAVGVFGEQNDRQRGRGNEGDADHRLLHARFAGVAPAQKSRTQQGGAHRGGLYTPGALHPGGMRHNHPQAGDLGDRQVEENDPALQNFGAQGHVGGEHQEAGGECGQQNAELQGVEVHNGRAPTRCSRQRERGEGAPSTLALCSPTALRLAPRRVSCPAPEDGASSPRF